ncbi:MAG TPA: hypothetical protein VI258_02860 [Rhodanobacteraceae bacterium]
MSLGELILSGRVVDVIFVVIAIEVLAVGVVRGRMHRGVRARDLLTNLASGIFLLLALRAALVGAGWHWIGMSLAAAFAAHLFDLSLRWRSAVGSR